MTGPSLQRPLRAQPLGGCEEACRGRSRDTASENSGRDGTGAVPGPGLVLGSTTPRSRRVRGAHHPPPRCILGSTTPDRPGSNSVQGASGASLRRPPGLRCPCPGWWGVEPHGLSSLRRPPGPPFWPVETERPWGPPPGPLRPPAWSPLPMGLPKQRRGDSPSASGCLSPLWGCPGPPGI